MDLVARGDIKGGFHVHAILINGSHQAGYIYRVTWVVHAEVVRDSSDISFSRNGRNYRPVMTRNKLLFWQTTFGTKMVIFSAELLLWKVKDSRFSYVCRMSCNGRHNVGFTCNVLTSTLYNEGSCHKFLTSLLTCHLRPLKWRTIFWCKITF